MDEIITKELETLIKEGKEKILPTRSSTEGFVANATVSRDIYACWIIKSLTLLKLFLDKDDPVIYKFVAYERNYYSNAIEAINVLEGVLEYINKGFIDLEKEGKIDSGKCLERIFSRFHIIARQLRNRHDKRQTIDINDEYDVQDLLHALLKLYFDDVRAEEWTPSYAGKCARMDFLIKEAETVIEVKKTRQALGEKEVGDQLIVDIERYQNHPNCKKLICFVYDPEGRIGNPRGLEKDLKEHSEGFVEVYIRPE